MERVAAVFVVLVVSLFSVTSAGTYATCNETAISCIKENNGGSFILPSLKVLWNRDYSITWYSNYMVQKDNLTCVSTTFSPFGCVDSYWNNCSVTKEVTFDTGFNPFTNVFSISNYESYNLKAYGVYKGRYCMGLYVCSPEGTKPPHVTVYCRTDKLSKVDAEVEAAKGILTTCNINDGVAICTETC